MRFGWIMPHLGCFGSVREVIEMSNALVYHGHDVTIHNQDGSPCKWLQYDGKIKHWDDLAQCEYDLLLLVTDWRQHEYELLLNASSKIKGVVLMGFTPSTNFANTLKDWPHAPENGEEVFSAALNNPEIEVFADGPWQLEWVKKHIGCDTAVAIGGINTRMFKPNRKPSIMIGWSGDMRPRKGGEIVQAAIELIRKKHPKILTDTYWAKYDQKGLVDWYNKTVIFLDAQRRAGWNNPVFEAMACGCAVICTNIPAIDPLVVHRHTGIVVPVDDPEKMAEKALWLLGSEIRVNNLSAKAIEMAQKYDYRIVAQDLIQYVEKKL